MKDNRTREQRSASASRAAMARTPEERIARAKKAARGVLGWAHTRTTQRAQRENCQSDVGQTHARTTECTRQERGLDFGESEICEGKGEKGEVTMSVKRETLLRLEDTLKRRYRELLRKGEGLTATTMVANIRMPDGLTEADVMELAKQVMLEMYQAQERRHHLKLARSSKIS